MAPGKDCHPSERQGYDGESRKDRNGLHGRLLLLPADIAPSLVKSAERHRRPLPDLRIGPFAPELGDGFQVPPDGTLGTPLADEFGTHFRGGCVPSMPFLGLAWFCFAPTPPALRGSFLL
jgi:hypothetical protein